MKTFTIEYISDGVVRSLTDRAFDIVAALVRFRLLRPTAEIKSIVSA